MAAPEYRILAANALTNVILDELPIVGVSYSRILNGAGSFSGAIPLDGRSNLRNTQLVAAAEPDQIMLYVQRNGIFQWGGLLTAHNYDSAGAMLTVNAVEAGAYIDRRYIVVSDPAGTAHTGDIATLATNFVTAVFADQGPPLLTAVQTAGVTTTLPFNVWEQHKVGDLVRTLSGMVPGFDWAFDAVADANGNPTLKWIVYSPRRGVKWTSSGIVLDYPGGGVLSYKTHKDGALFASDIIATGAGSGATLLTAEVQTVASSYVKLTTVLNNKDIAAADQLASWARAQAAAIGITPPIIPSITALGSAVIDAGTGLGDELVLVIAPGDPYYPAGASLPSRVVGIKTFPPTDSEPEKVELTLGAVL